MKARKDSVIFPMYKAEYFESNCDIVDAMYNEILYEMQQIAKFNKNNEAHRYALYLAGSFLKNRDRAQVIKYYSDDKLRVSFIEKNPKTTSPGEIFTLVELFPAPVPEVVGSKHCAHGKSSSS